MSEFIHQNKLYYHSVEFALSKIGGIWKMPVLWRLKNKTRRFGEIKGDIPRITDKVLSTQLKELEADGFIIRKVYAQVPPKVEYTLTRRGKKAIKIIEAIRKYGFDLMKDYKVEKTSVRKVK